MAVLQDAYDALWNGIDNWPFFSGVFQQTYRFDGIGDVPEINPSQSQLPALAIYPDPGVSQMALHKKHEHAFRLLLMVFTTSWSLAKPFEYWEELVTAAWKSDGGSGVPYVKKATGQYPDPDVEVDYDRIYLGGGKATLTTIRLTLPVRYTPQ